MTVSARKAASQQGTAARKRKCYTTQITQAWRRNNVDPLRAVRVQAQALWRHMAQDYQRAWERSDVDGSYRMTCYPSQATLAEHHGVSVETIRRWTRELEAAGLIEVEIVTRPGDTSCLKRCNYQLVAPMRSSTVPAAAARRATPSARGFARPGVARTPAPGVVPKVDAAHRRDGEQAAYIEKLAMHRPQEAEAMRRLLALQRESEAKSECTSTAIGAYHDGNYKELIEDVFRAIPDMTPRKLAHMVRESPVVLAAAFRQWTVQGGESKDNPAGYLVTIYESMAKRDRIARCAHAA